MKINVTQVLKQRNGESVKDVDVKGNAIDATLRPVLINVLEAPTEEDRKEQPIKKYERGKLADRIYDNVEVELSAEEVSLLKNRAGKLLPNAYIVKVIWDLLEG